MFCLRTFHLQVGMICRSVILPDNSSFVIGCDDNTAKLCDLHTGNIIRSFRGHIQRVFSLAICKNGNYLVTGSHDKSVKVWNIITGQEVKTIRHIDYVTSVAVTSDCQHVVTGSFDGCVKVWNINTGTLVRTIQVHTGGWVVSLALTSDETSIVVSIPKNKSSLKLFDIKTGKETQTFPNKNDNRVVAFALSDDGKFLVAGGHEGSTANKWDIQSTAEIKSFQGKVVHNSFQAIALSSDGRYLATAIASDGPWKSYMFKLWNFQTGEEIRTYGEQRVANSTGSIESLSITSDGRFILSTNDNGTVKLWSTCAKGCIDYRLDYFYGRGQLFPRKSYEGSTQSSYSKSDKVPESIWAHVFAKLDGKPDYLYYYIRANASIFVMTQS